ncbi:MAG: hypothetical protein ABSC92_06000 [Rhizomicrobium sp.]
MKRSLVRLGAALTLLSATAAFGDTLATQCHKADCVQMRCDDWRENCTPAGYLERTNGRYAAPQSQQVCNEFGDCHFALPGYPPLVSQKGSTAAPK